ncbi:LPS O-antigen chain length determinant protein WzzB [Frederiksenia canicola]
MNELARNQSQADEIDLLELMKVLWDKKWWIVLSAFFCTAIAGIYAFTVKEQWTSKAEIIAPREDDLGSYLALRKEYARILGGGLDTGAIAGQLYAEFDLLAYSLDERENFLKNSEMYKVLSEGKSDNEKRAILNQLARKNISIVKPDAIGKKFTVSAETAQMAQEMLRQYINYLSKLAFEKQKNAFIISFKDKLADLTFEYQQIQRDLSISKTVQLQNLNKAFETAEKAGVTEYSKVLDNSNISIPGLAISEAKISLSDSKLSDDVYLFMLGTKYLHAQMDVINKNQIIYPPRFYQIEVQLKQLEPLFDKTAKLEARAFSYLSSPDYPIVKDKPKKALILIIAFIVGLMLSIMVLLILNVLRKVK